MTALDDAWMEWLMKTGPTGKRSQGENWRLGNSKGEWPLLLDYRNGGPRPDLMSRTGRQMVFETDAWKALKPPGVAPPVPPFTNQTGSLFLRNTGNVLTEKIHVTSSLTNGIGNMVWPPKPSTGLWTLRDCLVENVADTIPRSWDGRAEMGFWIGQKTLANRLRARFCAWSGLWTGAMCNGTNLYDFDLSGNPHVAWYLEHITNWLTMTGLEIDHRGADGNAVNVEWWYKDPVYGPLMPYGGKAGSHSVTIENFDITVDNGNWAFFLDAGTFDFTIRDGIIRLGSTGKGIAHPRNLMDPSKPNKIDWASIEVIGSGQRELVHNNLIG